MSNVESRSSSSSATREGTSAEGGVTLEDARGGALPAAEGAAAAAPCCVGENEVCWKRLRLSAATACAPKILAARTGLLYSFGRNPTIGSRRRFPLGVAPRRAGEACGRALVGSVRSGTLRSVFVRSTKVPETGFREKSSWLAYSKPPN